MNKRKEAKKKGYDSGFEMELHAGPMKDAEYHPDTIEYTVPERKAKYTADFKLGNLVIEAKGFFRADDPRKYKNINEGLSRIGLRLVFIFEDESKKMPGATKRKDGTYLTMGEWADKIKIPWFNKETAHNIFNLTEE